MAKSLAQRTSYAGRASLPSSHGPSDARWTNSRQHHTVELRLPSPLPHSAPVIAAAAGSLTGKLRAGSADARMEGSRVDLRP